MLWDSCINMSWPFKLSPHITNLNLNEPPLQIHQQAMTLHPLLGPGPSPYSILLPPATHIHQQAIISRYPSIPPPHACTYPLLPQPHQLHSTHLIKRGRTGRRRNGGGSLYRNDFLRWLSSDKIYPKASFYVYYCSLLRSVCVTPTSLILVIFVAFLPFGKTRNPQQKQ